MRSGRITVWQRGDIPRSTIVRCSGAAQWRHVVAPGSTGVGAFDEIVKPIPISVSVLTAFVHPEASTHGHHPVLETTHASIGAPARIPCAHALPPSNEPHHGSAEPLMRILLVNKYVHVTGGADLHCLWLAAALRSRGHEVRFVSTADEGNLDHDGVFVAPTVTHATRDGVPLWSRPGIATKALWNRDAARATREILAAWRPDVVHAHKLYPQLSVAPLVEARRAGIPIVQTLHDFELVSAGALDARGGWRDGDEPRISYRLANTATLPLRRLVHVRRVSAFIAVSRFVAGIYRRHGIESSVLPNFVARSAEVSIAGLEDRSGIAFVGRLTIDKGIRDVLQLAAALPDVPVTIVGAGALENEVRERASGLSNITLTGRVSPTEAARIVANARLVVLPSRWQEPAGLVAVEAMASGTPVVAYASGGLAEYVGDAGGGLVVPRDPVTLATSCARLLADDGAWSAMSSRGREAARTTHSEGRYVAQLEEIYTTLRSAAGA